MRIAQVQLCTTHAAALPSAAEYHRVLPRRGCTRSIAGRAERVFTGQRYSVVICYPTAVVIVASLVDVRYRVDCNLRIVNLSLTSSRWSGRYDRRYWQSRHGSNETARGTMREILIAVCAILAGECGRHSWRRHVRCYCPFCSYVFPCFR